MPGGEPSLRAAELHFQRRVAGDPLDCESVVGLSHCVALLNRRQEAVGVLRTALERDPERHELRAALAALESREEPGTDAAVASPDARLPLDADRGLLLAQLLSKHEAYDEAIGVARAVLADGRDCITLRLTLGQILAHVQRTVESIEVFDEVLRREPDNVSANESLAHLLPSQGRLEEALGYQQKVTAGRPGDVETWLRLGELRWSFTESRRQGASAPVTGLLRHAGAAQPVLANSSAQSIARSAADVEGNGPARLGWLTRKGRRAEIERLQRENAALLAENEQRSEDIFAAKHQNGIYGAVKTWVEYENTKYFFRNRSLFSRLYGEEVAPVPAQAVSDELSAAFSMGGRVEIEEGFLNAAFAPSHRDFYTDRDFALYLDPAAPENEQRDSLTRRSFASVFYMSDLALGDALGKHPLEGARVAVVDSINPYYEALCLRAGAKPTALGERPIESRSEKLVSETFDEARERGSRFDAALSIFSLAQAGLGVRGDAPEPDADLRRMQRLRELMQPDGLVFLAVPVGRDRVIFNAARIYGRVRLAELFEGWEEVGRYGFADGMLEGEGFALPVFVLRPKTGSRS